MNIRSKLQHHIGNIIRPFFVLLIAGGAIGAFHHLDGYVALGLTAIALIIVWKMWSQRPPSGRVILCVGMGLTGFLGVCAELWGIQNGYWAYHDLRHGRHFPYWLPVAWVLAFIFLYRVELRFIELLRLTQLKQKILLAAVVSIVLPTWGEIITINMGVWTYSWGLQFFGVPLVTMFLLMALHMGIYFFLVLICRIFAIDDIVFGSV